MPSKQLSEVEFCFPCKYWYQHLIKSGREPVYETRCQHPTQSEKSDPFGSRLGTNRAKAVAALTEKPQDMETIRKVGKMDGKGVVTRFFADLRKEKVIDKNDDGWFLTPKGKKLLHAN